MRQRLAALPNSFLTAKHNTCNQVHDPAPPPYKNPQGAEDFSKTNRLDDQVRRALIPDNLRSAHASSNHARAAPPQFRDLLSHIGLYRRGIFICQVSNRQQESLSARRRCAANIPAIVNSRPLTNW